MTDAPLIDVRPDHWAIVRDILHKHVPHYEVWAFGSRAKWAAKEYSDLDLCIKTDKPLDFKTQALLQEDFSDSDLPWKVDVVDWATTSESFREIIERDRVVVQQKGRMAAEWKPLVLGNACTKIGSGATPRGGKEAYRGGATALIRSQNIYNDRFVRDGIVYIDDAQAAELRNVVVESNDVLLNITGDSVARCCQVVSDILPARVNQHVAIIRPKPDVLDARFLRYSLVSPSMQDNLLALASAGATRNALTKGMIEALVIDTPPVEQQRAIAEILGSLDDRIDNLRQTNATLEAIAAALFKSWFVDFDGITPEDMQESELGLIPKGWRVASLDSIANYLNGLALQKFPPENETDFLPVIKIAQLRAGSTDGADKASTQLKPEYIVEDGDVLFSWSGSLEVEVWTGGRGALNQHLFKVTSCEVPKWFYYFATRQHLPDFRAIAAGKATTMGHIQRKHLTDAKIVVPPPDVMLEFDSMIAPLFEQRINSALQARTLATLRDTLLPRFISGQLKVGKNDNLLNNNLLARSLP